MRLVIKNQYTSNQKQQKGLPGSLAAVAGRTFNEADRTSGHTQLSSLRIWRTSMHPTGSTQKHVGTKISDILGKPNGYVYRGADASMCHTTPFADANAIVMKTHKANTMAEATGHYDASNNRCVGPNPQTTVTKTASTVVRDGYAVSAREYQYKRGILPEQHASFTADPNQTYAYPGGGSIAPSDTATKGSQVYRMTKCGSATGSDSAAGCKGCLTTYKPRNNAFHTSGAVTSSARTVQLQHGTLMRENHSVHKTTGLAHHTNYLPGSFARQTIKTITELNCNVGSIGLTRLRHARRSSTALHKACKDCRC